MPANATFVRKTDSTWKARLVVNPSSITASASDSTNAQHANDSGTLEFAAEPTALVLMSIHTSPEQGTQLGRLLMLALARQAQRQGKQQMKISAPVAPTAFGFYATLGFVVDTSTPAYAVANTLEEPARTDTLMTLDMISDTDIVLQRATESADGVWELVSSSTDF